MSKHSNLTLFIVLLSLVLPALQQCDVDVCGTGGTCSASTTCTSCGLLNGLASYLYTDTHCYINCPTNSYK